jgi:hypothetical protein
MAIKSNLEWKKSTFCTSRGHDSGAKYWLIARTARVRFPVKSSGFFQITTIFLRRCKAVGPGCLLSSSCWVMFEVLTRPEMGPVPWVLITST